MTAPDKLAGVRLTVDGREVGQVTAVTLPGAKPSAAECQRISARLEVESEARRPHGGPCAAMCDTWAACDIFGCARDQ